MRRLLLARATLTCVTIAVLLASAPAAAAVFPLPIPLDADTAPLLEAEAVWLTELLLLWVAETEALCEIAPPATAAISTSLS